MITSYVFFYYIFCISTCLISGVGLQQTFFFSKNLDKFASTIVTCFFVSTITVIAMWLTAVPLLCPYGLGDLIPIFAFLFVLLLSKILNIFFMSFFSKSITGIALSTIIVLFALSEANSLLVAMCFVLICLISITIIVLLQFVLQNRILITDAPEFLKRTSLLLISTGIIILLLHSWSISWLNLEDLK